MGWNNQPCSLVWPWPLSIADIFQSVIEMASQTISMIYNTAATVCQRLCVCVHYTLTCCSQSPVGVPFSSFNAENYKTVDSRGLTKHLELDSVLIKVPWHRSPLLLPAKKRRMEKMKRVRRCIVKVPANNLSSRCMKVIHHCHFNISTSLRRSNSGLMIETACQGKSNQQRISRLQPTAL